jgi:hypothetical protein
MFRNRRAVQLSFVKEPKEPKATITHGNTCEVDNIFIENVARHGKDFLTHAAVTAVVAYSAMRVVDTICKIAVVTVKAKVQ